MTEMGQADALIGPRWLDSLSFPEQRLLVTLLEHSDLSWISFGVFEGKPPVHLNLKLKSHSF